VFFRNNSIIQQEHFIKLIILIIVFVRYLRAVSTEIKQHPVIRSGPIDQPVFNRIINFGSRCVFMFQHLDFMTFKSHQVHEFPHHADIQADAVQLFLKLRVSADADQ